jgi:probable addiction module antidote protein
MEPKTESTDAAEYFGSEDEIVAYLTLWMKDGSPREIARAVGDVARSSGITEVRLRTGERRTLHPALSPDGNPTLDVLMAVLGALGLEMTVKKKAA